ncbi:MAG TPA: diguanylate cyclase [Steroidobacteraceae bacterium]|nr:diguanylate cyclase [Steroidobacteraceae bacterium]
MKNGLWAALVSLAFPALAGATDIIILPANEPVHLPSLSSAIELFEDPGGQLAIEDVARVGSGSGFVAATPKTANVGFSRSAWWVRFTLRNSADQPRLVYLEQGYPLIDLVDLYEPIGPGTWRLHATGDRRPFDTRDIEQRDFLFPLTLPAGGERTYYLRFASQGPVDISLALLDSPKLIEEVSREQLAYGLYFGCVLMLLVWSGLVFVAVRDPAFFAYFAYVATFGLYMTVNTGFAFEYLWPNSPRWGNTCLIMLLGLALITALQFSTTILRARDYTPRLERVARGLQVVAAVVVALVPFLPYSILIQPMALLILVSVIFMLVFGIVSLLAGSRPAVYYVIAWSAFLAGSVIFLLKNFGLVAHTFMSQHSWQLGSLLEMILLSMTLSSRMNELKNQSRTDPLTLLGNRRLFDDRLPVEFEQARQLNRPLSLLMLDIDNFKAYNDRHGHSIGDEAIKQVGAALRRHSRKPVLACRYGGDEFCMILPGIGAEAARNIGERLRAHVEAHRADWPAITVSVGFASLAAGDFASHDKLFDAADAALYSAKEAGRNRVAGFEGRRADDLPPSPPRPPA